LAIVNDIEQGEGKILELKREMPANNQIAKTAIAFSNTSGGRIIIGVDDELNITGIDTSTDIFKLKDKIVSIISDSCYPNILPDIYTTNIKDKVLLIIEIFRGNLLPYYLKNKGREKGTYIRVGAVNRVAGPENIAELERQFRHIGYDQEIDNSISFDSLDITLLDEKFKSMGKILNKSTMKTLKLLKEENGKLHPTRGLMILLGQYDHCKTKCSRFKGNDMAVFLDSKEYGGNLINQLENAETFIKNHLKLETEITGLQRTERYEIPLEAIREGLVNAIVHRDYSNEGRDIKVGIYDNMMNIVSPGSYPNTITQEDVLEGRSEIRNQVIARVFKELGYIEMWGSGIRRIISSCEQKGLKTPEINEKNDFVEVRIYREKRKTDEESKNQTYTTQEEAILQYMRENNRIIKAKEAADILNVSSRRARTILNQIIEDKYIERVGEGPATQYRLVKDILEKPDNSG